jgi:N-acetylmuramoyl-L-alanine amidase-like protein
MRTGMLWQLCAAGLVAAALGLAAASFALAQSGSAPPIVPRSAWGAKPANTEMMKAQTPREIVIHHTGERQQPKLSLEKKLRGLQSFSQAPGSVNGRPKVAWGDVPYHFYIDSAGRIGEGRDVGYAGDTNTKYNTANRIQIVVEGHFDKEEPSPAQLQALDQLVVWLAKKYRVPPDKITGHNDHASTDCPGKHLKSYLPTLREKVAKAFG